MKENSIEEDIILLKDFTEGNFKRDKLENYKGSYKMGYFYYKDIQQAIEHILSDYKRALKENEEWDIKFCNLQNLYFKLQDESESKRKEYQETYKDVRKELKEWQEAYKSEKKMKNEYVKLYQDLLLKENVIPVQKVKEKISERQFELQQEYKDFEDDVILTVLQELIEESE